MHVFKFGGASIATPARMKALLPILNQADDALVVVMSALGKTTNALEAITKAACGQDKTLTHRLLAELEEAHATFAKELLDNHHYEIAKKDLEIFFTELQWAADEASAIRFDYSYDQIVCLGEILSTRLFSCLLRQHQITHQWIDIRDVLRTDSTFRDAKVEYNYSKHRARALIGSHVEKGTMVITQGFIGATADNASVTLGREGSDYTAALVAAMLSAQTVTIWKDVEGLQNADPRLFDDTIKIDTITYHEVIEMAYYGAQVIHPKTIKPLENNNIPLYVKCFLNKDLRGTLIKGNAEGVVYPSIIVLKKDQVLVQVTTRDFSFITEDNLSRLYYIFHSLNVKINLIQNAAISFIACLDNREDKLQALLPELQKDYQVLRNEGVCLLTIRHYSNEVVERLTAGKDILLQQKTRHTLQIVFQ